MLGETRSSTMVTGTRVQGLAQADGIGPGGFELIVPLGCLAPRPGIRQRLVCPLLGHRADALITRALAVAEARATSSRPDASLAAPDHHARPGKSCASRQRHPDFAWGEQVIAEHGCEVRQQVTCAEMSGVAA